MSEYTNPEIPEGINVTPEHPLKALVQLVLGITAIMLLAVVLLARLGEFLALRLSVEQENALLSAMPSLLPVMPAPGGEAIATQQRLQALAVRLARHMDWPPGMHFTVQYSPAADVNAFASLGGHIVVCQGLLDAVDDEIALAMVIAHELAHVRLRHPVAAAGRGMGAALVLAVFAGVGDVVQGWVNTVGSLTMLRYSREQEAAADAAAIEAVYADYGTVAGAAGFFEKLDADASGLEPPALFSTHPGHAERIERIHAFARQHPDIRSPSP